MSAENGTIVLVLLSLEDFFILDNVGTLDVTKLLGVVTDESACNVVALAISLCELMLEVFIAIPKPPMINTMTAPSIIPLIFI